MQIGSNLTLHAARAYAPAAAQGSPGSQSVARETSLQNPVGAIRPADASPLGGLVAGRAAGGIEFERPSVPANGTAFQLYTRAADKVEAAVAVQLGRTVDVRG